MLRRRKSATTDPHLRERPRAEGLVTVSIEITRTDDGYVARVTPPHSKAGEWASERTLTQEELRRKMVQLGVHEVDMWDFIRGADRRCERGRQGSEGQ
jgi:hypothetical protein